MGLHPPGMIYIELCRDRSIITLYNQARIPLSYIFYLSPPEDRRISYPMVRYEYCLFGLCLDWTTTNYSTRL